MAVRYFIPSGGWSVGCELSFKIARAPRQEEESGPVREGWHNTDGAELFQLGFVSVRGRRAVVPHGADFFEQRVEVGLDRVQTALARRIGVRRYLVVHPEGAGVSARGARPRAVPFGLLFRRGIVARRGGDILLLPTPVWGLESRGILQILPVGHFEIRQFSLGV